MRNLKEKSLKVLVHLIIVLMGGPLGCNTPTSTSNAAGTTTQSTKTTTPSVSYTHFAYAIANMFVYEYGIDPQTGNLEPLTQANGEPDATISLSIGGLQAYPKNILMSPNGKWLYFFYYNSTYSIVAQYSIDQTTGLLTKIGSGYVNAGLNVNEIAIDASSNHLYAVSSALYTYVIDQNTGALTSPTSQPILANTVANFTAANNITWTTTTGNVSATENQNQYEINTPQNRIDLYQDGALTSYSTYLYEASSIIVK